MSDLFEVDMKVKIKENSPVYPGKPATITRLGLGGVESTEEIEKADSWMVMVRDVTEEVEVQERYLEPIPEEAG